MTMPKFEDFDLDLKQVKSHERKIEPQITSVIYCTLGSCWCFNK
jgi:gallidermin/nisin family lantibiotic